MSADPNRPERPRVVVGIDGSEPARRALQWAADEAGLRGAVLHVVHACSYPVVGGFGTYPALPAPELFRREAEDMVAQQIEEVLGSDHGLDVLRDVVFGPPANVLTDLSKGADLLVVGARGRGGFAGLLLGSVSQQCAHHAACPLAIIRGDAD